MLQVKSPWKAPIAALLVILALACTTEKAVYVLPDGTEVTPTAAQATQIAGGGLQTVSLQSEEATAQPAPSPASTATAQPAPSPTSAAIAGRESRLIRLIIENKPPNITGYGFQQRVDYTPDCAEVYYIYGSSISGRPPMFTYDAPGQGLFDKVIGCDDDGNHYFTEERYVDMLWRYLGGEE